MMEAIYGKHGSDQLDRPMGVGLGNFDGLHIGHMALINTLISESRLNKLGSVVYTFTKHPENILRKKLFTPLITTANKKLELLSQTPLDYTYFDEFDETYSRMQPETFVKEILVGKLKAKLVVAGFNYRFGYKGQGNSEFLIQMGKKHQFKVVIIPPVKIDNEIVSSSLIRKYIAGGAMDKVFKLLGRHYSITGKVQNGRRIGNTMGFPTANIHPEDYLIMPVHGVYITKTLLDGVLYNSVTNIGRNPTFKDSTGVTVETHLLDFNEDIYGNDIEVFFISRIRGEKAFKDKDELAREIERDVIKTREFFNLNGNS